MNLLDRLEALVQRIIEGTFNHLFQTQLSHENGDKNSANREKMMGVTSIQNASHWLLRLGEQELRLGEPVVRIGRALDNDIVLTDPAVSRYHAQLRWREGCYYLCPPTSANGDTTDQHTGKNNNDNHPISHTTVNQQAVGRHPLISGDVITVGDTNLTVLVERDTA